MIYKIREKRLINGPLTINYDILQRLSFEVDLNDEEALEGLYIAAGLQLHAPGSSLLFYSSDAEYVSGVLSFNVNTYTENFLNNVTKIGTKAYLEIAQMQDNYKEVLLFDDIIVEPRVYSEGMTPEPIDPSEWATRSWVLGTFEKKITEDRKLSYDLISGAPEVGSGTIILTQGGVEKGRFNVNQSGDFSIDFDLGPEGSVTSSWVVANFNPLITQNAKLSYSLISGTPAIPTKTSDLQNDSGFTTQSWVNLQLLSYQKQITQNSKLSYSLISGTPTIGSGTIVVKQGGTEKGRFNVNQTSNLEINLDEGGSSGGATEEWVTANFHPLITSSKKLSYSLISGTPAIPTKTSDLVNDSGFATSSYVDEKIALKQDLITEDSKLSYELISGTPVIGSGTVTLSINGIASSFNLNQSENATLEYTVQGGGGISEDLRPFKVVTSSQLDADWNANFLWGLLNTPNAILSAAPAPLRDGKRQSYQAYVDINLSGSTVTVNGCTLRGTLFDGVLNRCLLTVDGYNSILYTYDTLPALPMRINIYSAWTSAGQDADAHYAIGASLWEYDNENQRYVCSNDNSYYFAALGTNWRIIQIQGENEVEIAMGPESEYDYAGTYGTIFDEDHGLHGDSILEIRREDVIMHP